MGNGEPEFPHVDMPSLTIRYIDADELIRRIESGGFERGGLYLPNDFAPGYHPCREILYRKEDIIKAVKGMMNPDYYCNRRVTSITVNYLPTHEIYAYQLRDNPECLAKIATRETLKAALKAQEENGSS